MEILLTIAVIALSIALFLKSKAVSYWRAEAMMARSEAENLRLGAAVKYVPENAQKTPKTETQPLELCEGAAVSWAIEGGKTVAKIEA